MVSFGSCQAVKPTSSRGARSMLPGTEAAGVYTRTSGGPSAFGALPRPCTLQLSAAGIGVSGASQEAGGLGLGVLLLTGHLSPTASQCAWLLVNLLLGSMWAKRHRGKPRDSRFSGVKSPGLHRPTCSLGSETCNLEALQARVWHLHQHQTQVFTLESQDKGPWSW